MLKISLPCLFNGAPSPVDFYVGEPKEGNHPIQNQAAWLSKERGGTVPQEHMEQLATMLKLAQKNNVSFEELCLSCFQEAERQMAEADKG